MAKVSVAKRHYKQPMQEVEVRQRRRKPHTDARQRWATDFDETLAEQNLDSLLEDWQQSAVVNADALPQERQHAGYLGQFLVLQGEPTDRVVENLIDDILIRLYKKNNGPVARRLWQNTFNMIGCLSKLCSYLPVLKSKSASCRA